MQVQMLSSARMPQKSLFPDTENNNNNNSTNRSSMNRPIYAERFIRFYPCIQDPQLILHKIKYK